MIETIKHQPALFTRRFSQFFVHFPLHFELPSWTINAINQGNALANVLNIKGHYQDTLRLDW